MNIEEILLANDVNLALKAKDKRSAVLDLLGKLRGDSRVKDWDALSDSVLDRDAAAICEGDSGICIAHGRTSGVSDLVMAAGRAVPGAPVPEIGEPVTLFFVVGIPAAFDAAYLRLVGAIARVCREPEGMEAMMAAESAEEFVTALAEGAARL
ncbi:MAG: PTS sugar transporter subunit IIA [Chthoniobacterales bacterium]